MELELAPTQRGLSTIVPALGLVQGDSSITDSSDPEI